MIPAPARVNVANVLLITAEATNFRAASSHRLRNALTIVLLKNSFPQSKPEFDIRLGAAPTLTMNWLKQIFLLWRPFLLVTIPNFSILSNVHVHGKNPKAEFLQKKCVAECGHLDPHASLSLRLSQVRRGYPS